MWLCDFMRQQVYEKECWGLGKEEEGVRFKRWFFVIRKGKGGWGLWWEEFLIVFIVAMGINFLMLVA